MKTRKLIAFTALNKYANLHKLGVPLNRIIRDHSLQISNPHLSKLLEIYYYITNPETKDHMIPTIEASMFPDWLEDESYVQEQPDNYTYTGRFPNGTWEMKQQ